MNVGLPDRVNSATARHIPLTIQNKWLMEMAKMESCGRTMSAPARLLKNKAAATAKSSPPAELFRNRIVFDGIGILRRLFGLISLQLGIPLSVALVLLARFLTDRHGWPVG